MHQYNMFHGLSSMQAYVISLYTLLTWCISQDKLPLTNHSLLINTKQCTDKRTIRGSTWLTAILFFPTCVWCCIHCKDIFVILDSRNKRDWSLNSSSTTTPALAILQMFEPPTQICEIYFKLLFFKPMYLLIESVYNRSPSNLLLVPSF